MHPTPRPAARRRPVRQAHPIDAAPRFGLPATAVLAVVAVTVILGGLAIDGGRLPGAAGIEPHQPVPAASFATFGVGSATGADRAASAATTVPAPSGRVAARVEDALSATLVLDGPMAAPAGAADPAPSATPAAKAGAAAAATRPTVPVGTGGQRVRATFLGDSYSTGWNGFGRGSRGWPAIVARDLGWKVTNLAVAGTGFVNPGWTGQPLRTMLRAAVRSKPQVVVVATGHNDSRYGAAAVTAARRDLARLRRELPDATIVVIAPIWANGSPPSTMLRLRTALRREAKAIHAVFVDPLAGGWFAGARHRLISSDGIHPTDAGHRHIARLVLQALRP